MARAVQQRRGSTRDASTNGGRRNGTSRGSHDNGTDSALFDGYHEPDRPHADAYDEMFAADGTIRTPYRALHDAIAPTAAADLAARSEALDRAYVDQGITFSLLRRGAAVPARPRAARDLGARSGDSSSEAIVQRVRALEAFLADVYGDGEILRDGHPAAPADHHLRRTSTGPPPA